MHEICFCCRTTYYLANEILHGLVEKTISLPAAGPVLQVSAPTLGYSEFNNMTGFTQQKVIILQMFVKNVFELVNPFLANLHS